MEALKSTHQALVFMEDIAAVEVKLTQVPLYSILYKDLLSSTLTGGNQKQAPRFPTVMVQALEDTVVDETVRPFVLRHIALFGSPRSHPGREV